MPNSPLLNIVPPVSGALQKTGGGIGLNVAPPVSGGQSAMSIPNMNDVIKKAQSDYAAAKTRGDQATMQRAHNAAEAARRVASHMGSQNMSSVNQVNGKSFFDPIAYMWQAALRSPFGTGTPTLGEQELALATRQALAEITGYDPETEKPTWDREYKNAQLAISQLKAARSGSSSGGSKGLTPNQLLTLTGQQAAASLSPYLMQYKSYADMQADLPRIAPYLTPAANTELSKQAAALKNVYFDDLGEAVTPRDFRSGQGSPLFSGLSSLGLYDGGTSQSKPSQSKAVDATQQKIAQARSNGATDAQIRAALKADGIDPKKYGL